ncbi:methyltransferase domain-containing protein [Kibdelosporangium philippinense]|uniref:Methyltransferase domain-containing protein n=1 Tax=Kibdelosporangium philippinense TaxID=211113 RepID=A0ABS8Z237_9PSEU|nr:class I SAM-dependent methyltransferase [Kibdelosporangium philippinense]MCE7001517.1 methyltransferase domain-containing protein [Kibdelosporangium philippinense]
MAQWHEFVDPADVTEQQRLALLEQVFDPISIRNLDRIGIQPSWSCLEVGAGAGSIARALASRAGSVVVTDLTIELLTPLTSLGVTVLRHDVLVDDAPGEFDFIHCRYVLEHLPARQRALERMVSWLKPGGTLLVEGGAPTPSLSSRTVVGRAMSAGLAIYGRGLGSEPEWVRTLPQPLIAAGLVDCGAELCAPPVLGGTAMANWVSATMQLTDSRAVEAGLITWEELTEAHAAYRDPSFVDYTWLGIAAWGQKGGTS